MMMPTAFIWGCVYSIAWFGLRDRIGEKKATYISLGIAAVVLLPIPLPAAWTAQERIARNTLPDVTPVKPIALNGDLLLSVPHPRSTYSLRDKRSSFECNMLCLALLLAPGVDSVTVESSRRRTQWTGEGTRSYRLLRKPDCPGRPVVLFNPPMGDVLFGKTMEDRNAVQAHLLQTLSSGFCLIGEAPIDRYDFRIRKVDRNDPDTGLPGPWSLGPSPATVNAFVIDDGSGTVLARISRARATAPQRPLWVDFGGIELSSMDFKWARRSLDDGRPPYETPELEAGVTAFTTLPDTLPNPSSAPENVLLTLRTALSAAVEDPSLPANDPVFKSVDGYFDLLWKTGVTDADVELIRQIIRDPRIADFSQADRLGKAFNGDVSPIREAVADRFLQWPRTEPKDVIRRQVMHLNVPLARATPNGSFMQLNAREKKLLADPERRTLATALIARLSDQGARAVPQLLEILDYHSRNADERADETNNEALNRKRRYLLAVSAAVSAFCRLGPEGAAALPKIEALRAEGVVPEWFRRQSRWELMLARLGKPIENITIDSPDPDPWRRRMEQQLKGFDPKYCDVDFY